VLTSLPSGAPKYSSCWNQPWAATSGPEPRMLDGWECETAPWWVNRSELSTPYAQTGPSSWQHVKASDLAKATPTAVTPASVSNVQSSVDQISFDVSEIGKPVEVKESYFPNWHVTGAEGPYRLAPNLMVVVPTSKHVQLRYGLTGADWAGRVITVVGAVGLVLLGLWTGATRFAADDGIRDTSRDNDNHDNGGARDDTVRDGADKPGDGEPNGAPDESPDASPDESDEGPPDGELPDRKVPAPALP
jgi:hypothetical protein